MISDRSSRVTHLYCISPAVNWDPGPLPMPRKWGELRPTWKGWETLVSADNLEKLRKPTREKDCSPLLPPSHCPGRYDRCPCTSCERAIVSEEGRCLLSVGRSLPHLCTMKRPLLIVDPGEARQSALGPLLYNRPLCATDGRGGSSQPPGPQLLTPPRSVFSSGSCPSSVSLCFSTGSSLCPEAEREEGVKEGWEQLICV